tara:strand:+ start:221 stop:469 length:249 start_codon:yes stop_codon:yes gene_type:complete
MKFFMVIIICFGVDCQAIYEKTPYDTHAACYDVALQTTEFMQQMYPGTSGEVHCLDEEQYNLYNEFLRNGGDPSMAPQGTDA